MKWHSIRLKVLITLLGCLVIGIAAVVFLMRYSFERNSQAVASESVTGAQKLFAILGTREVSKMTAVGDVLMANPQVRDAFQGLNRQQLAAALGPQYANLKAQGITNVTFQTPEPNRVVFLRLAIPTKFGDHLNRYIDQQVVRTHAIVVGAEMARGGFALRVLRPFPDSKGAVAGYFELGEELGQFIQEMKSQTGNDYGLLLNKKSLDRQFWADASGAWHRRDNWDDNPLFVVADKTTDSDRIMRFDGDLSAIPGHGQVLEKFQSGSSVYIRGLFPIQDAAGNTVGAIFVIKDISALYLAMRHTQAVLLVVMIVALALSTVLILVLLNRFVFRRLEQIMVVATRVVGGDYDTKIPVTSDDEVGQFESLFEQFRRVFVDVLAQACVVQQR